LPANSSASRVYTRSISSDWWLVWSQTFIKLTAGPKTVSDECSGVEAKFGCSSLDRACHVARNESLIPYPLEEPRARIVGMRQRTQATGWRGREVRGAGALAPAYAEHNVTRRGFLADCRGANGVPDSGQDNLDLSSSVASPSACDPFNLVPTAAAIWTGGMSKSVFRQSRRR
jgi:hypothetical protein